jgi:hypothetical protein
MGHGDCFALLIENFQVLPFLAFPDLAAGGIYRV